MAVKKVVKKSVKKSVKKAVKKKKPINKKKYHLLTDITNECRNTQVVSFDTKEEVTEYLVDELEGEASYNFENADDIIIYGEIQRVSVTEKTYKVNIK